jgi:hypothetical protein
MGGDKIRRGSALLDRGLVRAIRALWIALPWLLPAVAQAQFTFMTNNGAITISGYTGLGGDVVIPSSTNGWPVTSIGDDAFFDRSLTSVTIPDSVTSIGNEAFYVCNSLTNVMIGNSVTNIGIDAFAGCSSLTSIIVSAGNPSYSSLSGVLFNQSQTVLIECPGGFSGSYAIPNSVTNIGADAFFNCTSLTSATVPNGVTSIGDAAFSGCTGLTGVTIPNGVTNIGDFAFQDCRLTSVTIPNTVTSIGIEVFAYCSSLTSVTIPDSVTNIGDDAFDSCISLGSVVIGTNVTTVGDGAFGSCSSLTNVMIGNGVTSIGIGAFASCYSLTGVTIPNSVTSIGAYAFEYCSKLTRAYFLGSAPSGDDTIFLGESGTAYYLPGTTGWDATFGGWPAALWYQPNPTILGSGYGLGATSNGFGFTISWATNLSVVVEASTNLVNPVWNPVATNTLVGGTSYFSDPQWTNYPTRYYRLRSP